jgi:hypothetical protein
MKIFTLNKSSYLANLVFFTIGLLTFNLSYAQPPVPPPYAPTDGLLAYWQFNNNYENWPNNYSFENSAGNSPVMFISDRDENPNQAIQVGISSAANNSGIYAPTTTPFNLTGNEVSLHTLVKINETGHADRGHIMGKRGNPGSAPFNSYILMYEGTAAGGPRVTFALSANINDVSINFPLTASDFDTWMFITATYDGANMRLYKNGVEVASAANTGNIKPGNTTQGFFGIGGFPNVNGMRFRGDIDESYLFNRALTEAEIASLTRLNDPLFVWGIAAQSQSRTICLETTSELQLFVTTPSPENETSFQWKKGGVDLTDGGNISGANSATLTITDFTVADLGTYTCEASFEGETELSDPIVLSEGAGLNNLEGLFHAYPLDLNVTSNSVWGNPSVIQPRALGGNLIYPTRNRFGNEGKALKTEGEEARFELNFSPINYAATISFWLKYDEVATNTGSPLPGGLIFANVANVRTDYVVVLNGELLVRTLSGLENTGVMINDNEWKHITYSNDLGPCKLYVNGELIFSGNTGGINPGADFRAINTIGYQITSAPGISNAFAAVNGSYDDLRVYNRILTDEEVEILADFNNPEIVFNGITYNTPLSACADNFSGIGVILENSEIIPITYQIQGEPEVTTTELLTFDAAGIYDFSIEDIDVGCNGYAFSPFNFSVDVQESSASISGLPTEVIRCSTDESNLVLTANITGNTDDLTYQWYRNGVVLTNSGVVDGSGNVSENGVAGADTPILRVGNLIANQTANYYLEVSGGSCALLSGGITRVIIPSLEIDDSFTVEKVGKACLGGEANLEVINNGNVTQWAWSFDANTPEMSEFTSDVNFSFDIAYAHFEVNREVYVHAVNTFGCFTRKAFQVEFDLTPALESIRISRPGSFVFNYAAQNDDVVQILGFDNYEFNIGFNQPVGNRFINASDNAVSREWSIDGEVLGTGTSLPNIPLLNSNVASLTASYEGCESTVTATFNAVIQGQLIASSETICEGQEVTLTVQSAQVRADGWRANGNVIPDSNINAFQGLSSLVLSPVETTTYTVDVFNGDAFYRHEVVIEVIPSTGVEIIEQPAALIENCEGSTITLSVEATGADSFQWQKDGVDIDDANSSILVLENASFATSGNYTVIVSNNCEATATSNVAVVNITGETSITEGLAATAELCANETLALSITATGANLSYTWFKDNQELTGEEGNTLNITEPTSGVYIVEVEGTCGGVQTSQISVTVNPVPVISVEPISAICAGQQITLTASGADSFDWTGDVENGVAFTPTQTGDYTVVGTSNGCESAPVTVTVTVNPIPVISVEPISAICEGEEITLAASGADTFIWTDGVENGVAFTPTQTGDYTVVGTSNGCESAPVTVTVTVNPVPVISVEPISAICAGEEITLTASGADSFAWTDDVENGVAFTPTQTGDYTVVGTSLGCESAPVTITVTVNELPTLEVTAPTGICGEGEVTISATSTGTITFPTGVENGVAFTLTETSSYEIVTVLNGCEVSETITIEVNEAPDLQVPADFIVCENEEITLTATGANQITWDNDVENGVAFTITETTTFVATGINPGCPEQTLSVEVTVTPAPVVTVESVDPICEGEEITLTASGADSFSWTDGVENGVAFTPTQTGDYTVVGTSNGCESEPVTIAVIVNDLPVPTVSYDTNTESLTTGVFESYQWYFNGDIIDGAVNQTYQTTVEGTYTVEVTNEDDCEGTSETFNLVTVGVSALDRGFGFTLYPNPANNEVVVNFTSVLTEQIELQIFDLAGKQMGTQRINKMVSTIDVSHFAEGVYLFRVLSNNNAKTERVIIKH